MIKRLVVTALLGWLAVPVALPRAAELLPVLEFSKQDGLDASRIAHRDLSRPFSFALSLPGTGVAARAGADTRMLNFTADKGSRFEVFVSPRVPPLQGPLAKDAGSLAVVLDSDREEDAKDKIMANVVPFNTPEAMLIDNPGRQVFIGFDLLFDEGYQVSPTWTIHLQAWQCCSGHPPLTVNVRPSRRPDDPIQLDISVINDDTEMHSYGHGFTIASVGAQRGQWMNLVLALLPRACPDGSGRIAVWKDGAQVKDWHGCWGFQPAARSTTTRGEVKAGIGLDLGVYRRRQPLRQMVLFDDVRYGTTLADVLLAPKPRPSAAAPPGSKP